MLRILLAWWSKDSLKTLWRLLLILHNTGTSPKKASGTSQKSKDHMRKGIHEHSLGSSVHSSQNKTSHSYDSLASCSWDDDHAAWRRTIDMFTGLLWQRRVRHWMRLIWVNTKRNYQNFMTAQSWLARQCSGKRAYNMHGYLRKYFYDFLEKGEETYVYISLQIVITFIILVIFRIYTSCIW